LGIITGEVPIETRHYTFAKVAFSVLTGTITIKALSTTVAEADGNGQVGSTGLV
jgi:hypothetical protein